MINFLRCLILLGLGQHAVCAKLFDTKYVVIHHENPIDAERTEMYRHSSNYTDYSVTFDHGKLEELLNDITEGIHKKIKSKRFVLWEDGKLLYVPSITTEFTVGYDIYDNDLSFLGTVQIENDITGRTISKLAHSELPESSNCSNCNH